MTTQISVKVNVFFKVELDGLTGRIKFDQQGLRTGFYLQIIELKKSGLQQVITILQTENIEALRSIYYLRIF